MKWEKNFIYWYSFIPVMFGLVLAADSFMFQKIGSDLKILFWLVPSVFFVFIPLFHIIWVSISNTKAIYKSGYNQKNSFKNYFPKWWIQFISVSFTLSALFCVLVAPFLSDWNTEEFIIFNVLHIFVWFIGFLWLLIVLFFKNKSKILKK